MGKRKLCSEMERHQKSKYRKMDTNRPKNQSDVVEVNHIDIFENQNLQFHEIIPDLVDPIPADQCQSIVLYQQTASISSTNMIESATFNEHNELKSDLRWWAVKNYATQKSINELLFVLNKTKKFDLPKDSRTLMKTPRKVKLTPCHNGTFSHLPVKLVLDACLSKYDLDDIPDILNLNYNFDGVAIYKNGDAVRTTWPILAMVTNLKDKPILHFGSYSGMNKPDRPTFLKHHIRDFNSAHFSYTFKGKRIKLNYNLTIMDLQAVTYIHGIPGPTAKIACLYCNAVAGSRKVNGKKKVIHPLKIGKKFRTDEDFRKRADRKFHRYESPLVYIPDVKFVSKTLIDVLHCVYEGNFGRLVKKWFVGLGKYGHSLYAKRVKLNATSELMKIKEFIPTEFNRKLRGLEVCGSYKVRNVFLLFDNTFRSTYQFIIVSGDRMANNFVVYGSYCLQKYC